MIHKNSLSLKTTGQRPRVLNLIAGCVFLSGWLTIFGVLFAQTRFKQAEVVSADAEITIFVGLTFIYLASLLRRGKQFAWAVVLPLYFYIVIRNARHFFHDLPAKELHLLPTLLNIVVPSVALLGLLFYWRLFNVRSGFRNFIPALRVSGLVILVAFLYGVLGFQLLDNRDFHREIPLLTGAHYTVDQFGLTENQPITPYTKRAQLFLDSLAVISLGSIFYVGVSLFGPIRFRLSGQPRDAETMGQLLEKNASSSEDFFKLWPRDKAYFFNAERTAGLAYHTARGAALMVGDPIGKPSDLKRLIVDFSEYCRINDWEPAFIHTLPAYSNLYKDCGFELQKIGQEAVIDLAHFNSHVANNKYFRNIAKRFESHGYSYEVLSPPHNDAVIKRLREISDDWLKGPGRAERGFMLGYFSEAYMQQSILMVARDAAGTIQGFINQIPVFKHIEANFDLLRHTKGSLGNVNDYLLLNFTSHLAKEGYKKLNMGLAPLAGLEAEEGYDRSALDSILGLVYSAGGRFYSFQGLKRFKSKYEPEWEDRYVVYRGGLAGFMRAMNALLIAMRVRKHLLR